MRGERGADVGAGGRVDRSQLVTLGRGRVGEAGPLLLEDLGLLGEVRLRVGHVKEATHRAGEQKRRGLLRARSAELVDHALGGHSRLKRRSERGDLLGVRVETASAGLAKGARHAGNEDLHARDA